MSPRARSTDWRSVEAALAASAADLARDLLGPPSSISPRDIRWGRKGSLSLSIAGSRVGRWHDFEHAVGGGMIDLIRHALDLDFPAALTWGERWLGGRHEVFRCSAPKETEQLNTQERPIRSDRKNILGLVDKLWSEAIPVRGTPAHTYLERRQLGCLRPEDDAVIRFHPHVLYGSGQDALSLPSLLTCMRCPITGEARGLQRTPLSPDGAKHPLGRRMLGRAGAAMVSPDVDVAEGLFLAEGLEDALAARLMGYAPVWAVMSASGSGRVAPLAGVECVTFLVDGDDGGASLAHGGAPP